MIFAAGLGTRLKPLTDTMPKALVPVAGKPLLRHVIEKLEKSGFGDIVINVHHFSDQIIQYLKANNNFGLNISVSDETERLLDTGGGIKKASSLLGENEPFLIHNVDIISNADLVALYKQHIQSQADATLLVSQRKTSRYLLFNQEHRLQGWKNETTGEVKSPIADFDADHYEKYAFSGIHVMSPSVFKQMECYPEKFPIMDFYISEANQLQFQASVSTSLEMIDVGKLNSLDEAEKKLSAFNGN